MSSARSQDLSLVLYFKQRQAESRRHRASTRLKPFCKPTCNEDKTSPHLGLGVPAPFKILCSNTSLIWNWLERLWFCNSSTCSSAWWVFSQKRMLRHSPSLVAPSPMMKKMTGGSVGRDKELAVPWIDSLQVLGTNRGLYLEELSFFCQHWRWTQGLRGKKGQDKAYTMGMSGTLLMTIIWVKQRWDEKLFLRVHRAKKAP